MIRQHTSLGMSQLRAAPAPGGVKVPALVLPSGPAMSVRLATCGTTGELLLCSSADLQGQALFEKPPTAPTHHAQMLKVQPGSAQRKSPVLAPVVLTISHETPDAMSTSHS